MNAKQRMSSPLGFLLTALLLFGGTSAQASDYVADSLLGWENNKWSDGSEDCKIPLETEDDQLPTSTEWHVSGSHPDLAPDAISLQFPCSELNALKIKKPWGTLPRTKIAGGVCVCTAQNEDCVRVWGNMAYIGAAYNLKFTTVGFNRNGCGTKSPNSRVAGYIRLKSDLTKCVQTVGDVSEGMSTHLWGDCGTGENQQRRVMAYLSGGAYQTIRVAANPTFCLALNEDGAFGGNPIVARKCSSTDPAAKKWLYENGQIKLKADSSKCMRVANDGSRITLRSCVDDNSGKWLIQWTQDH